jgi:hypothetical protein
MQMNFVDRQAFQPESPSESEQPNKIALLIAQWFAHRARAQALWAEMDVLALQGVDATEQPAAKLCEESSDAVASAEAILETLRGVLPRTIEEAHRLQSVAIAILDHRRREGDITASLAVGPIVQILENVRLTLRVISGEMTYGDAHDARLIRQADTAV